MNRLECLETLAIRDNPCMTVDIKARTSRRMSVINSRKSTPRRSSIVNRRQSMIAKNDDIDESTRLRIKIVELLAHIPKTRLYDNLLRIVDIEIRVKDRLQAWKTAGGDAAAIEEVRPKMALFLRTNKKNDKAVKDLDLDAMELRDNILEKLSKFMNLSTLRMRGNKIVKFELLDFRCFPNLKVLDVRDNLMDMRPPSLSKYIKQLEPCQNLIFGVTS